MGTQAFAKCKCENKEILKGQEAYQYSKLEQIKEIARAQGGWRYLLKCKVCGSYWEMTWEGGGGFNEGVMTLRRLSEAELVARWPDVKPE